MSNFVSDVDLKKYECTYKSCMYYEKGCCIYHVSPIQIPYYQTCRQDDLDSIHFDLYGD